MGLASFIMVVSFLKTSVALARPETSTSTTVVSDVVEHGNRRLIVQGVPVEPQDYPYFALTSSDAYASTRDKVCGAILIHSDILLSAAHCQGYFNYGVQLFSPEQRQFDRRSRIVEQWRHPDFNRHNGNYNWDILVMRLAEPVYDIEPALLNNDPNVPSEDEILKAVGFGALEYEGELSSTLMEGEVRYMLPSTCGERIAEFKITGIESGEDVLCTESTDAGNSICLGDSGGPLLTLDGILVGVTSWTVQCQVSIPNGFARVSTLYDWIQEKICEISAEKPGSCVTTPSPNPTLPLVEMRLQFRHDFSPEQTTFAVRNLVTTEIEYAGPTYVVPDRAIPTDWNSTFYLTEGSYAFEVYDKGDDGLSDTAQNARLGQWELYARYQNGTSDFSLVASGDNLFLGESIADFEIRAPPPTQQSTPPTSFLTSNAPMKPTLGPTLGPIGLPTATTLTPEAWTALSSSTSKNSESSSNNEGLIIGMVATSICFLIVVTLLFIRMIWTKKHRKENSGSNTAPPTPSMLAASLLDRKSVV